MELDGGWDGGWMAGGTEWVMNGTGIMSARHKSASLDCGDRRSTACSEMQDGCGRMDGEGACTKRLKR
eukprot:CAMPEP_0174714362 /NCGR_PEP_ID=MMETSP1094-20130205/17579_1 /TAXON_ID=156173 /ORGANISM="Chrysochromulina brevifilum, Strain UTEX LB 985" /LENGTH=67 /DNA_ID=CAMNT_0015913703 /DNA_START=844 /DNA_END=1047 /DNA_ORIENTATION=+